MRSKKYLNKLGKTDLIDIMKNNKQKITHKGIYLTKEDMIKNIRNFYK